MFSLESSFLVIFRFYSISTWETSRNYIIKTSLTIRYIYRFKSLVLPDVTWTSANKWCKNDDVANNPMGWKSKIKLMSKIDSFRVKIAASLFSTFIKTNWHFSLKMNYVVWFSNNIRWYIRKTVKPVKCYTPFEVEFVRISYSSNSLLCERAIHFLAYTIRLILSFATGLFVCCLLPSYSQTQHRFTFLFRW